MNRVTEFWQHYEKVWASCRGLTQQRGADYGRDEYGAYVPHYFPFGNESFFQMVWLKVLRMRSIITAVGQGDEAKLLDSIYDCINYLAFWGAAITLPKHESYDELRDNRDQLRQDITKLGASVQPQVDTIIEERDLAESSARKMYERAEKLQKELDEVKASGMTKLEYEEQISELRRQLEFEKLSAEENSSIPLCHSGPSLEGVMRDNEDLKSQIEMLKKGIRAESADVQKLCMEISSLKADNKTLLRTVGVCLGEGQ